MRAKYGEIPAPCHARVGAELTLARRSSPSVWHHPLLCMSALGRERSWPSERAMRQKERADRLRAANMRGQYQSVQHALGPRRIGCVPHVVALCYGWRPDEISPSLVAACHVEFHVNRAARRPFAAHPHMSETARPRTADFNSLEAAGRCFDQLGDCPGDWDYFFQSCAGRDVSISAALVVLQPVFRSVPAPIGGNLSRHTLCSLVIHSEGEAT